MSFIIKETEDPKKMPYVLVVQHTCGHQVDYAYASKNNADRDGPLKSSMPCVLCRHNENLNNSRR